MGTRAGRSPRRGVRLISGPGGDRPNGDCLAAGSHAVAGGSMAAP